MKHLVILPALVILAGCAAGERLEGARSYYGPTSVIATGQDQGIDKGVLIDGEAALAYDPDGCQVWIMDDGLEGYATPRVNPETGKPICDNKYPPGTVIGKYQTSNAGIPDLVSGPGRKVVVRKRGN